MLGAAAALASSATWAYASARYAQASREVSPVRVNLVRMAIAWPAFVTIGFVTGTLGHGLTARHLSWLTLSTFCSYAFADTLFFAAARRIGVSSALAIASSYPLWAALKGTIVDGEPFGLQRALGTLLCVGGVAAIVKLTGDTASGAGEAAETDERARRTIPGRSAALGVPLALVTSVLWAGNTISIKAGAIGLAVSTVNSVRYLIAIIVLGTLVLIGRAPGATRPSGGWRTLVPAIVSDCLFGSFFFVYGLRATDLAVGATLTSLAPLLALPIALWLGLERASPPKLAAVVTTVAGIALLAAS
jgi:drug/metabolite transporter (DMT)-like permease